MEYVTLQNLKDRVQTTLSDTALSRLIAQESAVIALYLGVEPGSPVVQTFVNPNNAVNLAYRPSADIVEIVDMTRTPAETIDSDTYFLDGRVVYRRGRNPRWPAQIQATYMIQNRDAILALCESVCVELCGLSINGAGAYQSESIGGYSYSLKDAKAEHSRVISKLGAIRGIRPVVAT